MPTILPSACRLLCAAPLLLGGVAARADLEAAAPAAAPLAAGQSIEWSTPELAVRYELLPPHDGQQARGVLQGELEAGAGRLRTRVHIEPDAQGTLTDGADVSWQSPAPGPLGQLVVGDGYTSGAGWSAPARVTGIRFGRAQTVRAPLRAQPAPVLSAGFASAAPATAWERWRAQASGVLPSRAPAGAPAPVEIAPLAAGATDWELELGRLRDGADTSERHYLGHYGAAAYRAGLARGLTAEARAEWSDTLAAQGVELLQQLGDGVALQAVAAQSYAPEADGQHWGLGIVLPGEQARARLAWTAADRDFRSATASGDARRGLRLETSLRLGPQATAEASFTRTAAWDAASPESVVAFGSELPLSRQVRMRVDVSRMVGLQAQWRAGMSLAVPFD